MLYEKMRGWLRRWGGVLCIWTSPTPPALSPSTSCSPPLTNNTGGGRRYWNAKFYAESSEDGSRTSCTISFILNINIIIILQLKCLICQNKYVLNLYYK